MGWVCSSSVDSGVGLFELCWGRGGLQVQLGWSSLGTGAKTTVVGGEALGEGE